MKHVLHETPQSTVQRFETRNGIITPPSVPVKQLVVESLPSLSASVENYTPREFEIETKRRRMTML